jgi:hypothetical protein
MTRYNLTDQQKLLLSSLVHLTNEGKLKDPVVPIPVRNGKSGSLEYVLHLRGADSFYFKNISDLDTFCDLGLMVFRWNRQGIGKLYSLTRSASAAVDNEFERPFTPPGPKYRPELIVQAMNGYLDAEQAGQITPDIDQIAADPILLHTTVEALIDSLLEVIHQELQGPSLADYTRTLNSFKDALYSGRLTPKELQSYARQLTCPTEDAPLLLNTWPYLYPLLLIAEKRI